LVTPTVPPGSGGAALQLLGERVAQRNGIDSAAPRHLSRVVRLALPKNKTERDSEK
jgi:hypothetical protein